MELDALEITEVRFLFKQDGANEVGPEASMLKVRGTEIQGDIFELTMMCAGGAALGARRDETGVNIDGDAARPGQRPALFQFPQDADLRRLERDPAQHHRQSRARSLRSCCPRSPKNNGC